ncbi:MAG: fumarylacetoacetate hydrolase family protein [Chloroflexaceae bacterium]|nr:fumarylacetoacetate hydrolase family protein [Chloroflexaceae bacterium]
MKLVTFVPPDGQPRAGVLLGDAVIDLAAAAPLALDAPEDVQWDMLSLLQGRQEDVTLDTAEEITGVVIDALGSSTLEALTSNGTTGNGSHDQGLAGNVTIGGVEMLLPLRQVSLLAPLPRPSSLRLVDTEDDQPFPLITFGNHGAVVGPDADIVTPFSGSGYLGCWLAMACVIGQMGRDIAVEEAADYIAGYTLLNEWHDPYDETGLADFAYTMGPYLVTPDELELYTDDEGALALTLNIRINSATHWRGNFATQRFTFAALIAHASRDVTLYPGDVIGYAVRHEDVYVGRGDMIELEATGLGVLSNRVV